MKKFLTLFLLVSMMCGLSFAQTEIQIMKHEAFSNNLPSVIGDNLVRPDGREAWRWFKVSEDELPYSDLASGAKITIKLSHIIPWEDDTTLSNAYAHTWKFYVVDKQKTRYQVGQGIVQFGDSNYVELDISFTGGLLQQDSVALMYWMGTWATAPVYVNMDLEITTDQTVGVPYWIEQVAAAGGIWSEQSDSRWENSKMIIPDDSKDRILYYVGQGTGEHGSQEVSFKVDQEEIYRFSPYVEDCEKYLEFNNAWDEYGYDSTMFTSGRTGSCYGGIAEPVIMTGDIFNNYLTPGFHSLRLEPQLWQPDGWSDYSFSALMYGEENTGFSEASKFMIATANLDVVAADRSIPVTLYMVNESDGPISSAEANIQLSGDNLLFSDDNEDWENPLVLDHKGASRMIYVKSTVGGTHTMTVEDLNGVLATNTLEFTAYANLARTITDDGTADGSCNWNAEAPKHAIDGKLNTKWCNNDGAEPNWVKFGFDTTTEINFFAIHHAEAGGESAIYNTSDFEIKVFNNDSAEWEVFSTTSGNEAAVTYHKKADDSSVNCDSVMLYVTLSEAGGGNVARIYEIEMFNDDELVTSVGNENEILPKQFKVFQNYPNPFNPSTSIEFFTPRASKVDIRIYNAIGQEVSRLLTGQVNAGTHTLKWNGTNSAGHKVAGGVYFYSVRFTDSSGNNSMISKKMVLLP